MPRGRRPDPTTPRTLTRASTTTPTAPRRLARPRGAALRLVRELHPHLEATPHEVLDTVTGPFEHRYATRRGVRPPGE